METLGIVYGSLEALVLLVGLLYLVFAPEIAKLVGLAVWTYGTVVLFVLFLLTVFVHDHVHFGVH